MGEEQQQPQQFDADEIDADQEAQWDREQEDEMNAFPTTEGYLDGAYYSDDEADQDFTEY
jgi:hypothetical protein